MAIGHATMEIVFVLELSESMKIKVVSPVVVRVDNVGAIFMAKNISTLSRGSTSVT